VCLCGPSSLPWNLVFCSLSQLECMKKPLVMSLQCTTCIYVAPRAACSCLLHSGTHSRRNHQCKTVPYCSADYLTLGPKLCLEYLLNPLQINFLATGTLAANYFHSALPTPVRLFKYSSCFFWSRWCMCFINVSYLLHCCLYLSLELLSKGGCAQ